SRAFSLPALTLPRTKSRSFNRASRLSWMACCAGSSFCRSIFLQSTQPMPAVRQSVHEIDGVLVAVELVQEVDAADLRVARVLAPLARRVGHHAHDLLLQRFAGLAHVDVVAVALRHLAAVGA